MKITNFVIITVFCSLFCTAIVFAEEIKHLQLSKEEQERLKLYNQWIPVTIDIPMPLDSIPPQANFGYPFPVFSLYGRGQNWKEIGVLFTFTLMCTDHSVTGTPYPKFYTDLEKNNFSAAYIDIPRHSIIPILGCLYLLDIKKSEEGRQSRTLYSLYAHRVDDFSVAQNVRTQKTSLVFPFVKGILRKYDNIPSGQYNDVQIILGEVLDTVKAQSDWKIKISTKWKVSPKNIEGTNWENHSELYSIGDMIELRNKKYKLINIVLPDTKAREVKCLDNDSYNMRETILHGRIVGWVELDWVP